VLAPVVDTAPADIARMIDVNLIGTVHGLQAAARWFLAAGRAGRIVNIASEVGVQAFPYLVGYRGDEVRRRRSDPGRAAVEAGRPQGITVNAVCPGTAETDMVIAERTSEVAITGTSPDDVRRS